MKILITGGCGFIGSNFVWHILKATEHEVINLDALAYSGNPENLVAFEGNNRYSFVKGRIEDKNLVSEYMGDVDYVVNFAAESHVDRSILDPRPFIVTNVEGTQTLLEACRQKDIEKFVHISTDEVYGELGDTGKFTEDMPLLPNSPYSASKAAAEMIVRAYRETYGLPVVTARPSNNYGYRQYPEKLIPLVITNLIEGKPVPVYGEGKNVRDWIFVEDCCAGIDAILNNGNPGEIYNVGGENERRNIEIVRIILKLMNMGDEHIRFVEDRPGHDYRYALDNTKIRRDTGWKPKTGIEEGLAMTIKWYKENPSWWKPLKDRLIRENKGFWS